MKRILLTGMSGTGKSSMIGQLAARGYKTADMDDPGWSEYSADGEWLWREDRVQAALSSLNNDDVFFMSGCAINQVKFYPQFDKIVLLSAPADVIVERLTTRTNNPYGSHPDDIAETLTNLENVEPLLRKRADHEIVTTVPLDKVVESVVKLLDTLC